MGAGILYADYISRHGNILKTGQEASYEKRNVKMISLILSVIIAIGLSAGSVLAEGGLERQRRNRLPQEKKYILPRLFSVKLRENTISKW